MRPQRLLSLFYRVEVLFRYRFIFLSIDIHFGIQKSGHRFHVQCAADVVQNFRDFRIFFQNFISDYRCQVVRRPEISVIHQNSEFPFIGQLSLSRVGRGNIRFIIFQDFVFSSCCRRLSSSSVKFTVSFCQIRKAIFPLVEFTFKQNAVL